MFIGLSEQEWKKYRIKSLVKCFVYNVIILVIYSLGTSSFQIETFLMLLIIPNLVSYFIIQNSNSIKVSGDIQAKGQVLSNQISAVRKIICEGQASKKTSNAKISRGWMVLTEDALEYYELEQYQNGGNVAILIDDIVGTSAKGKDLWTTLVINTKKNTYSFATHKAQIWKEQIDKTVSN